MLSSPTFWTAVGLVLFLAIAIYFGLNRVLRGLDNRADKIRKDIEEAERLREEAQKTLADYKKKQREAQREAEEIVEHAKTEAQRMRERADKELEEQIERRERLTRQRIEQAEAKALAEVRNKAVDVAVAATAQLMQDNLSQERSDQLVDQAIQDVQKRLN
jgi:F-type H+-transporting ATPase subunit b